MRFSTGGLGVLPGPFACGDGGCTRSAAEADMRALAFGCAEKAGTGMPVRSGADMRGTRAYKTRRSEYMEACR